MMMMTQKINFLTCAATCLLNYTIDLLWAKQEGISRRLEGKFSNREDFSVEEFSALVWWIFNQVRKRNLTIYFSKPYKFTPFFKFSTTVIHKLKNSSTKTLQFTLALPIIIQLMILDNNYDNLRKNKSARYFLGTFNLQPLPLILMSLFWQANGVAQEFLIKLTKKPNRPFKHLSIFTCHRHRILSRNRR